MFGVSALQMNTCLHYTAFDTDPAAPEVCGEGDGEHVHGGAAVVHQPAEVQPGESASVQGGHGLQVLPAEAQALQQVHINYSASFDWASMVVVV